MSTHVVSIGSYQALASPPVAARPGVIGGFAIYPADWSFTTVATGDYTLGQVTGLAINVGGGCAVVGSGGNQYLYIHQPWVVGAPTAPNAPANAQSWLWLTVSTGPVFSFYWNSSPTTPTTAGDVLIGWATTNATVITAWSQNVVWSATLGEGGTVSNIPVVPPPLPGGPGGTTYGDTGPPPAPLFGALTRGDGMIRINSLEWPGGTNVGSLATVTFQIYFVPGGTAPLDALTADATSAATTFDVSDGTAFVIGNYYEIDTETVLVTGTAATTITVVRAQLGSTATAHYAAKSITATTGGSPDVITCAGHGRSTGWEVAISGATGDTAVNGNFLAGTVTANTIALGVIGNGTYAGGGVLGASRIYAVQIQTATAAFSPQFFTSVAAPNWTDAIALPNVNVVAIVAYGVNAFGQGPSTTDPFGTYFTVQTFMGGQVTLQVNGTLGIASAACQPATTPPFVTQVAVINATVQTAPSGAAITVQVTVNGTVWATLEIPDGYTFSAGAVGSTLTLPASASIGLSITGVGTTYPGAGLTVVIQQ